MRCLFIALEGLISTALAKARAAGLLPSIEKLAATGALVDMTFPLADARVASLVSAMTGTWPDQHGILMAETSDDMDGRLRPMDVKDRAQPALWEPLDAHGVACLSVGWPVSITGETKHAAIVAAGLVHPPEIAPALADCWLRPDELDAGTIAALAPLWQKVNQAADSRLGALGAALAENVSRHAAFLELLDTQPWQCATLCLSLPGEIASLERASEPLADGVFAGLADRSMALLDAFLAEILRRAPADCHVIIAGLPDAEAPATPGFVLLHGPAFITDARLSTASVLDLVPLVWHVCGFDLPAMPGRGLLPAVNNEHPHRLFSMVWLPPEGHRPPRHKRLLEIAAPIAKKPGESLLAAELWHYSALSVLGRSLDARGEWVMAYQVLEAMTRLVPNDTGSKLRLSDCQKRLGLFAEALDTAYAAVHPQYRADPGPLLAAAELEVITGNRDEARKLLQQAAPYLADAPQRRMMHVAVLVALREWPGAVVVLTAVLLDHPRDAYAHMLLARSHLGQGRWQAAFDSAIEATRLDFTNARAHEILGHALLGMSLQEQAWLAFEAATLARPQWPRPWAKLAMLARQMRKPKEEITRLTEHYHALRQEAEARRVAVTGGP